MDHIDGTLIFPLAGKPRDDVRPGLRTTTYKKRTLKDALAEDPDLLARWFVFSGDRQRGRARSWLAAEGHATTLST